MSKLEQFRRFLLFLLISFSFGGFLFYASTVVPLASQVVGPTTQGFVTRMVTRVLNFATLATMCVLAWEIAAGREFRAPSATKRLVIVGAFISTCCLTLFVLHYLLNGMLDPDQLSVEDSDSFYGYHRIYLWVSTFQWLASLDLLWTLANSRRIDPSARSIVE